MFGGGRAGFRSSSVSFSVLGTASDTWMINESEREREREIDRKREIESENGFQVLLCQFLGEIERKRKKRERMKG